MCTRDGTDPINVRAWKSLLFVFLRVCHPVLSLRHLPASASAPFLRGSSLLFPLLAGLFLCWAAPERRRSPGRSVASWSACFRSLLWLLVSCQGQDHLLRVDLICPSSSFAQCGFSEVLTSVEGLSFEGVSHLVLVARLSCQVVFAQV